jgi:hypothetical protein
VIDWRRGFAPRRLLIRKAVIGQTAFEFHVLLETYYKHEYIDRLLAHAIGKESGKEKSLKHSFALALVSRSGTAFQAMFVYRLLIATLQSQMRCNR